MGVFDRLCTDFPVEYASNNDRSKDGIVVPTTPGRLNQEKEFDFAKDINGREWGYCALVTNDAKMDAPRKITSTEI